MSVEEHQSKLLEVSGSGNRMLSDAAQQANYYTELVKQGKLAREEYADLIEDIGRQTEIEQAMQDFDTKQKLHTALHGLIAIARAV